MEPYGIDSYGEGIADVYDRLYGEYDERMIDVLSQLARGRRALELGIGTGRVALPLKGKGVEVQGIDASKSMLAQLQAKPGGTEIPASIGDFSKVEAEGQFDLIYVVCNTFFALLTQEEQIACFRNTAAHLRQEGIFLIEAFVPDMKRFEAYQALRVVHLDEAQTHLDASLIDPAAQQITTNHIVLTESGVRSYPLKIRYVWPAELDLMARLSGLVLKERWGGWDRTAFDSSSTTHISLYTHP